MREEESLLILFSIQEFFVFFGGGVDKFELLIVCRVLNGEVVMALFSHGYTIVKYQQKFIQLSLR